MNIYELNVSDWVLYKGKPSKITVLDDDGITRLKTISDTFCSGYTQEMLKDMRPFTGKCRDCTWFSNFICKWRLSIARITNKPDNVANRKPYSSYCKNFTPSEEFKQQYIDK